MKALIVSGGRAPSEELLLEYYRRSRTYNWS